MSYECRSELSPSAVQITTQDQSPISKGSDILQSPSVQIFISDRDRFLSTRSAQSMSYRPSLFANFPALKVCAEAELSDSISLGERSHRFQGAVDSDRSLD